jgi:hypothetical protein
MGAHYASTSIRIYNQLAEAGKNLSKPRFNVDALSADRNQKVQPPREANYSLWGSCEDIKRVEEVIVFLPERPQLGIRTIMSPGSD